MKVSLGDVCTIAASKNPIQDDSVWLLNLDMVEQQTGKIIDIVYIDRNELTSSTVAFDEDVVLYSKLRPNLNKVVLPDRKGYATSEMLPLKPNAKLSREYLAWFLRSPTFVEYAVGKVAGAKMPRLGTNVLLETRIELPTLEEQKHIAAAFFRIDDLISKREQQLQKLDELVKARFVEMFGNPVKNPKGYRVDTLHALIDAGDIVYHLDGNHGGDYPRSEEFVAEGVPYIGANCISNGGIDFSLAKYLTAERAGKLRKGIAQNEDVLFAHNATVGPTVVLHTDEPKVILSTSLTAYRCNKESILPEYLATYMMSDGFVRQYSSEMKQTTRNQVPITAQKKYLFLIPPMDEQKEFAAFVSQVDKSKLSIQSSLDQLETLKQSLMQKYFG